MFIPLENLREMLKGNIKNKKWFFGLDFLTGFKKLTFKIIRFYQDFFSPNLGKNCRFYPSCSEYTYQAIEKYGLLKGLQKGVWRILRCNPFNKGGIDLPR